MSFPEFDPSTPGFLRHLQELYSSRDLIVYEGQRLTYGEAVFESARLARGMLASGITKGSRIGLLMPNNPDFVVAWLAAARIGARETYFTHMTHDLPHRMTCESLSGGMTLAHDGLVLTVAEATPPGVLDEAAKYVASAH